MSLKLSDFSPSRFLEKIDITFPKFKNIRENPKVKAVASQIFKALACIGFGAALGALTFASLGSGMMLIGIGVGAGIGSFTYIAVASVVAVIKKYGFPAFRYRTTAPIPLDKWLSDKNRRRFHKVFIDIAKLDYYNTWKKANKIKSDVKAEKQLWGKFQKGACQGESQTLISILKKHGTEPCHVLLSKIKATKLFYRQQLEVIRANLANDPKAVEATHSIPNAEPLVHTSFTKDCVLNQPTLFSKNLRASFKRTSKYQAVGATIRLQNDESAHTIFVQVHPKPRFYDSYDPLFTGFHEGFQSKRQMLRALQKHICGYHSKTRPQALKFSDIIIRGYTIDCPKAKEKEEIAQAGRIPLQK